MGRGSGRAGSAAGVTTLITFGYRPKHVCPGWPISGVTVNPILAPSPPGLGLCWPYGSLCEPILARSPPSVGLMVAYVGAMLV